MARRLVGLAGIFKIGKQLFTAEGPRAVERIARLGAGIFLDLKFHDIPNTVAGAVRAAAEIPGVRLVNVHALGGREMMRAAARAVAGKQRRPNVLGVTLLTSMNEEALSKVGILGPPLKRAVQLARLSKLAGLDGVVASPLEVAAIRRACGEKFLMVVPGIRPGASAADDQSRIATPAEAIRAGADYLVVGRPITQAKDPRAAAREILAEISSS
ncbi:MAG: orotidine-5'-phosphate decarboxylase [Acidobacteria bacterium]|nr:orotidine-5'-phosphate decarboxylase [Acidobacteriota bacterium]MCL5287105.1 orotidine-5'-phosphate decarboxylase [Acidobacteriota bacterium]